MRKIFLALFFVVAFVHGCTSVYLIWIPRSKSADPLYRFISNGKAGYIDQTGKIVIKPALEFYGNSGGEFFDGMSEIALSDGRYIDTSGRVVLDPGLFRGWDFSEGLAAAMPRDEKKWGYIDRTGHFVIPPQFPAYPDGLVSSFSDGLAAVMIGDRGGYIDHSGQFVIRPQFADVHSFHDGIARVVLEGPCVLWYPSDDPCLTFGTVGRVSGNSRAQLPTCKIGFIDKTGRLISPELFSKARDFSENLAAVEVGGKWGYIDKSGRMLIPPQFEGAMSFSEGLARIQRGQLYSYIDTAGPSPLARSSLMPVTSRTARLW